jgi:hypothetical protein
MKRILGTHKDTFLGVFPCDRLPTFIPAPSCLVYNTHPHDEPGEHWVAVNFPTDSLAEHFCSYGRSPRAVPVVQDFLSRHFDNNIEWNSIRIQGILSSSCGSYAVYFLYQRIHGVPMADIIRFLQRMGKFTADSFVVSFVNKIAKQRNEVFEEDLVVNQLCQIFLPEKL